MDRIISEKAIVDVLSKGYWDKNLQSAKDDPCVIDAMIDWAIRQIKAIPSAEPKTKQWIEEDMFDGDVAYRCSECNELFWIEDGTPKDNGYNFCPKCGANLVEPQEISDRNLKMWHDIYAEEKRREGSKE